MESLPLIITESEKNQESFLPKKIGEYYLQSTEAAPSFSKKKFFFLNSHTYNHGSKLIFYENVSDAEYIFFFYQMTQKDIRNSKHISKKDCTGKMYEYLGCLNRNRHNEYSEYMHTRKKYKVDAKRLENIPTIVEEKNTSSMEEIVFVDSEPPIYIPETAVAHLPNLEIVKKIEYPKKEILLKKILFYQKHFTDFVNGRRQNKAIEKQGLVISENERRELIKNYSVNDFDEDEECYCTYCVSFSIVLLYCHFIFSTKFEKQKRFVDDVVDFEIELFKQINPDQDKTCYPKALYPKILKKIDEQNYGIEWLDYVMSDIDLKTQKNIENGRLVLNPSDLNSLLAQIFRKKFISLMINEQCSLMYEDLEADILLELDKIFDPLYSRKSYDVNSEIDFNDDLLINPDIIPQTVQEALKRKTVPPCVHLFCLDLMKKKKAYNPLRYAAYLFYDCGLSKKAILTFYGEHCPDDIDEIEKMFDESKTRKLPRKSWIRIHIEGDPLQGQTIDQSNLKESVKGLGCKKMIEAPLISGKDSSQVYGCPYALKSKRNLLIENKMISDYQIEDVALDSLNIHKECLSYLKRAHDIPKKQFISFYSHPNNFSKIALQKLTLDTAKTNNSDKQ